jgi:signal transduction histidine kinase
MAEKILVVDDEQDIVRVLQKILEISGYQVVTAASGAEALKVVKEENPVLVLLDYMMPDLTGLDVLRAIKEYSEDIYVIMVTGRGSEEVAANVMKAGASDYVIKPFVKDQILLVVKDTLRIRQAEIVSRRLQHEIILLNRELEHKVEERTNDLMEARDRLLYQQNIASLGEMSGGMAHEIRNPLNSIALYSQIMMDELEKEDNKTDYLNKILGEVDRINAIVTNLHRFARRIKRDKEPTRLTAPLSNSLKLMSARFEKQGIQVDVAVDPDLPDVHASPDEMEEVFSHLIMNSVQAMPGGGELEISMRQVSAPRKNAALLGRSELMDFVEIVIKDTGMGIQKEDLSKIFIPFYTTKTDWEGTGLGLSVVNRIINDLEGVIEVESEPGKGAKFIIRLPALERDTQIQAKAASA